MSHLPGKKRTADLNRRMLRKEADEQPSETLSPESDVPLERIDQPRKRATLKKSDQEMPAESLSEAHLVDDLDDIPELSPLHGDMAASEPVALLESPSPEKQLEKRYASGQINIQDLGEVATAQEVMEAEWASEEKEKGNLPIVAIFSCIAAVVLCVAAFLFFNRKPQDAPPAAQSQISTEERYLREALLDREERKEVEAIYNQAPVRLKAFLTAKTIEEKARFIRQPERVVPLMRKYYETHELEVIENDRITIFEAITIENRAFWITALESKNGGDPTPVLMEQTEDNELLVDWETFVTYQDHDWDEMLAGRPEGEYQFRVRATAADYHVYEFSDPQQWGCLHLTGRGGDTDLYGFFRLEQPFTEKLVNQIRSSRGKPLSLVVTLEFPQETKAKKSAIITDVKSMNWVFVDPLESETASN